MKDTERRAAAKAFAEYWKDRGYEKGEESIVKEKTPIEKAG